VIVSRRELVLVLGLFIALAAVLLWPVPTHMARDIPTSGPPTDAMLLLYALTWSAHALGNDPIGLYQATFFYPYSYSLTFMENVVGLAVLMAPVNWAFGNMCVGFNTAWLLTFVISGLGAFLLVRYITDSTIAGILAGILFAFHPDRYHNAGQINNLAMMWIPFALLSLHLWVETRLRRHLFLFAAFSLMQFLSASSGGVFLLLATLLYVAVLLVVERRSFLELISIQRWVILALGAMTFIALIPFTVPYLRNARAGISPRPTPSMTALYSARPVDFVTPTVAGRPDLVVRLDLLRPSGTTAASTASCGTTPVSSVIMPSEMMFATMVLPSSIGSLLDPMAVAMRSVELAMRAPGIFEDSFNLGSTVLVIGDGQIAALTATIARTLGVQQVIISGFSDDKLARAQELSKTDIVMNALKLNINERRDIIHQYTKGRGADVVFQCAGSPQAFRDGIDLMKNVGTLVEVGNIVGDGKVDRKSVV